MPKKAGANNAPRFSRFQCRALIGAVLCWLRPLGFMLLLTWLPCGCQFGNADKGKPQAPYELAIFRLSAPNSFQMPTMPGRKVTATFTDYTGKKYEVMVPPLLTSTTIATVEPVDDDGVVTAIRLNLGSAGKNFWRQACHTNSGSDRLVLTVDGWVRATFPISTKMAEQDALTIPADWNQAEVDGIVYRAPMHFKP